MADPRDDRPQLDKFKDLAHELEADEDAERFEDTVRKIAPKAPTPGDDGGSDNEKRAAT